MHARDAVKVPYHVWVTITLTWIAGFVDIVGYIVGFRPTLSGFRATQAPRYRIRRAFRVCGSSVPVARNPRRC